MSAGLIHPVRPLGAPPLPREHGAWVMLLAPLGAGLVAAGPVSPLPAVALVVAAIAAFLTQNAAALLLRPRAPRTLIPWLGIYVGVLALPGGRANNAFQATDKHPPPPRARLPPVGCAPRPRRQAR